MIRPILFELDTQVVPPPETRGRGDEPRDLRESAPMRTVLTSSYGGPRGERLGTTSGVTMVAVLHSAYALAPLDAGR